MSEHRIVATDDAGSAPSVDGPARPVAIDLPRPDEESVRRWVEGVLGWQPVDGTTAALVPPTVRLVGPQTPACDDGVPRVLLLSPSVAPAAAADAVIRTGALAALVWPDDRDRLADVVADTVGRRGPRNEHRRVVRIGGVAGGVGTTTVVLALAGLAGWRGTRSLAALRGDAPVPELPVVPAAATAATDLWARLPQPPGALNTRAVRIADPAPIASPMDPQIGLAVLDHGVDVDVDVVVCRPDAAALDRLPHTTAAVVVAVGDGPVSRRDLARVASGRPGIHLPWSVRVARAGLHRRVPGSLPGAWLRRLTPLLPDPAGPDRPPAPG